MTEKLRIKIEKAIEEETRADEKLLGDAFDAMTDQWDKEVANGPFKRREKYRKILVRLAKRLGWDD